MSRFFALPEEVKQKIVKYFENQPSGTKIKRGFTFDGLLVEEKASGSYVLENSYIKLEKDIYALANGKKDLVGKGTFGKVKYAQALSTNNIYVVKIMTYTCTDAQLDTISREVVASYDLGFYKDSVSRSCGVVNKQYLVMEDAGTTIDHYLRARPDLADAARFDIAIQLCWVVHNLHRGMASRTGYAYAHRDIKPTNITINKEGKIRLIDLGMLALEPDSVPKNLVGAPGYLPNIATLLNRPITLKELDTLALKRTLFMPRNLLCMQGYKTDNSDPPFGLSTILPEKLLQTTNLLPSIDTSSKPQDRLLPESYYRQDILLLAGLLVLARFRLVEHYAEKLRHPALIYALLGLYFANQDASDAKMTVLISASIDAFVLSKVSGQRAQGLETLNLLSFLVSLGVTNHLSKAMQNHTLIQLVQTSEPSISRAAVLSWQNGIHKSEFLAQLKDNEALAKKVIHLIFDGDLAGLKNAFTELQEHTFKRPAKRPASAPNFYFPLINPSKAEFISPSSARAPVRPIKTEACPEPKKETHLPLLLFQVAKERRVVARATVEHDKPWRLCP